MINIIVQLIELYCFENFILIKEKLLYKDHVSVVMDKEITMLFCSYCIWENSESLDFPYFLM